MRFQPGDLVISNENPSRPMVVTGFKPGFSVQIGVICDGNQLYRERELHGTGMQVLPGRPRSQMRFGR